MSGRGKQGGQVCAKAKTRSSRAGLQFLWAESTACSERATTQNVLGLVHPAPAQGNQSLSRELRASALCPGLEAQFPARRREERGCSDPSATPSFPSQLEGKIGLPRAKPEATDLEEQERPSFGPFRGSVVLPKPRFWTSDLCFPYLPEPARTWSSSIHTHSFPHLSRWDGGYPPLGHAQDWVIHTQTSLRCCRGTLLTCSGKEGFLKRR